MPENTVFIYIIFRPESCVKMICGRFFLQFCRFFDEFDMLWMLWI